MPRDSIMQYHKIAQLSWSTARKKGSVLQRKIAKDKLQYWKIAKLSCSAER